MAIHESASVPGQFHWVCEQCGTSDGFFKSKSEAELWLKKHKEKCDAQPKK